MDFCKTFQHPTFGQVVVLLDSTRGRETAEISLYFEYASGKRHAVREGFDAVWEAIAAFETLDENRALRAVDGVADAHKALRG